MKELSIEEKAKRYDEALARANEMIKAMTNIGGVAKVDDIQHIFPELKESKDERISKEIRDFICWATDRGSITKEQMGKSNLWLSWLEAQGEQKLVDKIQLGKKYKCIASPRYSTFVKGLIYKPEDKFLCSLMNFFYDCFEPIEDGGQKPADKIEPKFKVGDTIHKIGENTIYPITIERITSNNESYVGNNERVFITIKFQDDYELVEQKPAEWSDEDEAVLDALIRRLEGEDVYVSPHLAAECLKFLKDRVQPKVELTQLDKNILEAAIAFVEQNNHFNYWRGIDKRTVLSALHSLRPQSQWKPSDEQMEALLYEVNAWDEDSVNGQNLKSLYQDLKKLRKE